MVNMFVTIILDQSHLSLLLPLESIFPHQSKKGNSIWNVLSFECPNITQQLFNQIKKGKLVVYGAQSRITIFGTWEKRPENSINRRVCLSGTALTNLVNPMCSMWTCASCNPIESTCIWIFLLLLLLLLTNRINWFGTWIHIETIYNINSMMTSSGHCATSSSSSSRSESKQQQQQQQQQFGCNSSSVVSTSQHNSGANNGGNVNNSKQQGNSSNVNNKSGTSFGNKQPPECFGCHKPILERYLLRALEQVWHEDCLKCSCCNARLGEIGSTLFIKADLILCKRDYLR